MKTTTLRYVILALIIFAPSLRAMETNNNASAIGNQNLPAITALLTQSEQRMAKLQELKKNITQWKENVNRLPKNVFGSASFSGRSRHGAAGLFGNAAFSVGWSHYSNIHESIYYVECRKKSELTSEKFNPAYEKYFPQITLTDEVLTPSVKEKLNYHLNTFIKYFTEAACPEDHDFINSCFKKQAEEPDNLQESYELVIEIIDNLIKSSNQKMESLAHHSVRSAGKHFNEDMALMIINENMPWQMCEKILAELPQELFEKHAKTLFKRIPTNQNNQDAQEISQLIIDRSCLQNVLTFP